MVVDAIHARPVLTLCIHSGSTTRHKQGTTGEPAKNDGATTSSVLAGLPLLLLLPYHHGLLPVAW